MNPVDVDVDAVLALDLVESQLDDLARSYGTARPFPHIVLDDLVRPDALARAYADFDAIGEETWRKYLHVNERKYANTDPDTWGPALRDLLAALASTRFVTFLERLTGFEGLQVDLGLDGGGLHRSLPGGYLNIHADFTAHHVREDWRRRVNILLYLNEEWEPEWGGDLELWTPDMSRCEATVHPRGNRLLVFTTHEDSFHGHPEPLACPPGTARRSLALYYFTEEPDPAVRSTEYRARPGDGLWAAPIYLDKQLLRVYDKVKRRLRLSDDAVSRWLGAMDRLRPGRRRPGADGR